MTPVKSLASQLPNSLMDERSLIMPASFQLRRNTPESKGISSAAIADFVATAEKTIQHLHSFMLLRHGEVVAEGWWYPWRPETPHMMFSLSKSFTSTAVGMAVAEGRLSVDDALLSFFPDDAPRKVTKNLQAMKVHHLLSMSTGHDQDTTERVFRRRDPIKAFLSLPIEHAPGTHFVYNSAASYVLSAIVQRLARQTLLEYLTPRLFEPLGISGATWESHPNGVNFGGWGLNLKTEDIARFGQLYLQKGLWNGKRILPEAWVEFATARQISNGNDPENDWTQGYGYQFWRCRHNIYRGDGAFGQFCIIMPEQEAVMAITAGVADMQVVLNLVWDKLLPAMGKKPLSPNTEDPKAMLNSLKKLNLSPPQGAKTTWMAENVSGKKYLFQPNYETLRSLCFDFRGDVCSLTYHLLGGGKRRGIHHQAIGYGEWKEGNSFLGGLTPQSVAASGVWTAEDTFTMTWCYYETPFIHTITCRFEGDRLFYDCRANVAFGAVERPQLVGSTE
jgi:CubicO group peptidase (beta-lactamase class C family)